MQILVNTNNSIDGNEALAQRCEATLEKALARFSDRITRVELHLHDANADKFGMHDKGCSLEARLGGMNPLAVTARAGTMDQAVDSAAEKMKRSLESTLGRMREQ